MLNDKLIIEISCNHIYHLDEMNNSESQLRIDLKKKYPEIEIIDIQQPFKYTQLNALSIQDLSSRDVAIIFQGSSNLNDWKNDNLNNFLNKNVNQYEAALEYYDYIARKDVRISYLGGNSLGGGCAQFVGLKHPHIRALCINASPLTNNLSQDTHNIINIRTKSDPLYRCVMLDPQRYDNGYVGQTVVVERSLYGSYDYYNSIELAHRGSIAFPYKILTSQYHVNNLEELKNVVEYKTYQEFAQLKQAPSLAQFMSFDLITDNLEDKGTYNQRLLEDNLNTRIGEIKTSLLNYHLTNLELKIGNKFFEINDTISADLSAILKHSLLHVTKQEESLYDSIYFVIEKSTNYFYKLITKSLKEIEDELDSNNVTIDYKKILNDIEVNKEAINEIDDFLHVIASDLHHVEKYGLKKLFFYKKIDEFVQKPQSWSLDYQKLVYQKIDDALKSNIVENKAFIGQLEAMIFTALMAHKIVLYFTNDKDAPMQPKDIDYIIERYNLKDIIQNAIDVFKEDIYEAILANSLFFIYQSNIRCLAEQIQQLQITLANLHGYLTIEPVNRNKRHLLSQIESLEDYLSALIKFNQKSLLIHR